MRPNFISPLYRLRWRFDFADRPSRRGMWSNPGNAVDSAAMVNKTGLVRAAIEAEHRETFATTTVLECDGHDFVNFEWIAGTPAPHLGFAGTAHLKGMIIGLSLVTSDLLQSVHIDGQITQRERTEYEKQNRLAAWRV